MKHYRCLELYIGLELQIIFLLLFNIHSIIILSNNLLEIKDSILNEIFF